ncbi:HipA domain-containing protein, partial [Cellulomonas soli]
VHQEDGAQLLGLNTDDPDRKFQWGRALPSLRELARVLISMGEVRPTGLLALTCFNLAIGNTDAHAKNISVIHREDGSTQLAPAYDVAMYLHHPHAARRFAMDVNGSSDMDHITAQDLVAEGRSWGLSPRDASRTVRDTLEHLQQALADIDRDTHPGVSDAAWTTVHTRTDALLSQAPASPPPARGGRRTAPRPEDDPAGRPS